jgi:sugar (pentulose or hexulose) kinase
MKKDLQKGKGGVFGALLLALASHSHAFRVTPSLGAVTQTKSCSFFSATPEVSQHTLGGVRLRRRASSLCASMAENAGCGLGFDFGTSGVRICVVDGRRQAILHEARVSYTEQSPDVWVDAMETLLDGIPATIRASISSVAVSGTSASVMLVDSRTGKVSRGPRMYDFAASHDAVALASSVAPEGHTVRSATSTLAKILQWHQESPILSEERIAHQADFLAAQLVGTGGGNMSGGPQAPLGGYTSDYNNALKIGYDVKALEYPRWMVDLLRALSLDAQIVLPAVVRPGGKIGHVTHAARQRWGLSENCQVVGGTTDSIAAFIAARAKKPGHAVSSLGSTLAIKLLSTSPGVCCRFVAGFF